MTSPESKPEGFIEEFNEAQTAELNEMASHHRLALLRAAGFLGSHLLRRQIEAQQHLQNGDLLEYWVGHDSDRAPLSPGRFCVSFMVEGTNFRQERQERLRILIPVEPDFIENDLEQVHRIVRPDTIYTERSIIDPDTGKASVYSRYMIDRNQSELYTMDEVDLEEQMQHPDFEQQLYGRVTERLGMLGRLNEDIVNWRVKPQRRSIDGDGPVEEV